MKKILGIVVLGLLLSNVSFAEVGRGTLNISDNVIRNFQEYLQSRKPSPVKFLITEDGQDSRGWFCPYAECMQTGSANEEERCRAEFGKTCYTLAIRRSIKWKNEFTRKAKIKERRFSSKDDFSTIKEKLRKLGLVGYGPETNAEKIDINQEATGLSSELINDLRALKKLYDEGVLTKEEFEKAKKKLLN